MRRATIVQEIEMMPIFLIAAGFPGLSWLRWPHHGEVAHPLVSLVVVAVALLLIARSFRRKPN